MGKNKQPPAEPAGDQTGDKAPDPEAPKDDTADQRDLVKSVLAELAASGEIFGSAPEDDTPTPKLSSDQAPPAGGAPDLEAAIARILERRDTESKAQQKEQEREAALTDLKEQVGRGLKRVRRWFEPASPWGD